MAKYKAKGGAGSFTLGFIILIIAIGLVGLTVWLVIKNTSPTTCDVSVNSVNVAESPVNGQYPVTITYSGNGSNACANTKGVSINVTLKDSKGNSTTIPAPSTLPTLSQGEYVVQAEDPKSTVSLKYNIVNNDGSEGPMHTY